MSTGVIGIVLSGALAVQGTGGAVPGAPERATLLQLSVAIPPAGAAELGRAVAEEAAKITSCAEGLRLGERLRARGLHGSLKWDVKTEVRLAALPAPLRDALLRGPVGRATPVFGGGEAYRVLIRCEPTFTVPAPPPSLGPQQRRPSTAT